MLLIMEFMENGSMDKYLKHHRTQLQDNTKQLITWTLEVAQVSALKSAGQVGASIIISCLVQCSNCTKNFVQKWEPEVIPK